MWNYQEVHGRLPPAVVYGEDGTPPYSWRVLILPYIEWGGLYKEFHLDEPWDSPHNIQLLPKMPATYAPPGRKAKAVPAHHTVCHVFVGKGAAFEGRRGLRLPADFPDGTSNTILVAEAGPPVPWTKPEDLPFDPDGPLPELRRLFKGGFRAGLADGSRWWFSSDTSETALRRWIRRDDGDIGTDW